LWEGISFFFGLIEDVIFLVMKYNFILSISPIPCIPKIMVQTDNGILSELGFMGLLGVVGRIIISF